MQVMQDMKVRAIVDEYIIREKTLALMPEYDQYGNLGTLVGEYDSDKAIFVRKKPFEIMEASLLYYGKGDLQGVMKAAKNVLGRIHMPPIMMSFELGMYWIPISSPTSNDCIWIAFHQIYQTYKISSKETIISFRNQHLIEVQRSKRTIDDKITDAVHLKTHNEGIHTGNFFTAPVESADIIHEYVTPTYSYIIPKKAG